MASPKGFILYEGASALDGAPIVVIATMRTDNPKTGSMVQTWIMRSDLNPIEASKQGLDYSVCGSCALRHFNGGACYVNIGQAPLSIYRAYKRGNYTPFDASEHGHLIAKRKVRLGAYGDPAAVPFEVFEEFAKLSRGHTGYTHQANHRNFDSRYLELCMVSADTLKGAQKAHALSARTFRVIASDAPAPTSEIECLSESEGLSCIECGLCDGKREAPSIYIRAHGSRAGRFLNNKARA
jgi:hypothetical protein